MTGLLREWKAMRNGMKEGAYPQFVTGDRVEGELPVFIYHSIPAHAFRSHLEHLRRNNYIFLDSAEVLARLENASGFTDREVLLTFDDGLCDLYTAAYPLLKQYGMKAVAFVAPHWIGRDGLITWPQAIEMHQSGSIDFQSHGFTHRRIPVSFRITDFIRPALRTTRPWLLPMPEELFCGDSKPPWGTPLFQSSSCLS
ncbi:MAG TPA: polysaccharide deacetylase family protein, partial [bacterium]